MLALSDLSDVQLGFAVAALPTLAMMISSAIMSNVEISPRTESILQYFCGGLIVAAVAAELFPLMLENVSPSDSIIGVTVGFSAGLCLVYGIEWVMEKFEDSEEGREPKEEDSLTKQHNRYGSLSPSVEMVSVGEDKDNDAHSKTYRAITSALPSGDDETAKELDLYQSRVGTPEPAGEWNEDDIKQAELAIRNPQHRSHVLEHISEIVEKILDMNAKSNELLDNGGEISVKNQENLAENIDKGIHDLQYLLDHTRRLVEGAEFEITGDPSAQAKKIWLTEDRKRTMRRRINALRYTAEHLKEHLESEEALDANLLKEVHSHMHDMEKQIHLFHDSVQKAASRWGRKAYVMPDPELGDVIPMGLVVPVTIDCIVDGFLIGVTVAISPKAGLIIGAANVIEMGTLGMAYSVRLKNCTGSSFIPRLLALYLPPIIMLLTAGLGAQLATLSQSIPSAFIGFVAFGTVALLSLACNELFVEALKALGEGHEGESSYPPSISMFVGVWVVIVIDKFSDAMRQ